MIPLLKRGASFAVIATFALLPAQLSATTLKEALISAYQSNPSLEVSRANLRSQDESVAQATSKLRPIITGSGSYGASQNQDDPDAFVFRSVRASLDARLMLFDGGQTRDAINAAENLVFAGRENLRSSDQSILMKAATAYLDVRLSIKLLSLSQNNVRLIEQQVDAMEERFAVGAVTRTEVSLTRAQLAASKTRLAASAGQLSLAKEVYRVFVGAEPTNLQVPPALPRLPSSLAEAESIAVREHPAVKAARYGERAAEYDLARARSANAPVISLNGQVTYNSNSQYRSEDGYEFVDGAPVFKSAGYTGRSESTDASISLSGQIPIYSGGAISSAMRSATEILGSRKFATQDIMRLVRQYTASSWSQIRVARASIVAARLQIEASQIAYDGIQEEVRLGSRTVLDLFDAEQNLLSAKSTLAQAQRDEYVAGYDLMSSMGLLTVENLALGIPAYDPEVHFNEVNKSPLAVFSGASILDGISDRWK